MHGADAAPPQLDWQRLERIRDSVPDMPLSLHGASGLSVEDLRQAVRLGICKVNVNTELRRRYLDELSKRLPDVPPALRVLELQDGLLAAVAEASARSRTSSTPGHPRNRTGNSGASRRLVPRRRYSVAKVIGPHVALARLTTGMIASICGS